MNIAYNILSGKTQDNPIIVVVDGDKASATVCWQYSVTVCDDSCSSSTTIGTECATVPIKPYDSCTDPESASTESGKTEWEGQLVYYKVIKLPRECECTEDGTETTEYQVVNWWLAPSFIECKSTEKPTLFYEYYKTVSNNCGIISNRLFTASQDVTDDIKCENITNEVIHKESTQEIKIQISDTEDYVVDVICGYDCAPCDECIPGASAITIGNVTYDTDYVLCSGGTVNATVNYRLIWYDDDCKKNTVNKVAKKEWNISPCTQPNSNSGVCCEDHYIISSTTISDGDLTANVALSILMKKSYDGLCVECDKIIIPTTKYCVKENSSKVYYKTYNDTWEESKDCNSAVPQGGGQIKVQFEYSAITKGDGVVISTVTGTTTKQLTIPMLIIDDCPPDGCETINGSFLYKTENEEGCNKVEYKFFQTCTANTPSTDCDCNDLFYDESPSDCNCNSIIYDNEPTTDCCNDIDLDVDPAANCCDDIELDIVPNNP